MKLQQVPVLYLHDNVFYPETIIPLVLSDDASKKLVLYCYNNDIKVALHSTHDKTSDVATIGKVLMVDSKKSDGTYLAVIQGTERVRLVDIVQHLPYPIYTCYGHPENKSPQHLKEGALEKLYLIFENWIGKHIVDKKERDFFLNDISSPQKLINNVALFMIKDVELKIILLESNSLAEKINLLDALLIGENPEFEDQDMARAIKNFDELQIDPQKMTAN
jgi:ATP-dependent Lon protease